MFSDDSSIMFPITIDLICYQLEESAKTTASWTLYNFGGYTKSLKWSSQSRPMTDLARKSRLKMSRQPSLFLSLQDGSGEVENSASVQTSQ